MIKAFLFIVKYKILKNPVNLSYHPKEFFNLSKSTQRKVLDKYFNKLDSNFIIEGCFDTKESRYYENHQEITFFSCYYFDKKIIEHNIYNIKFIDKFQLSEEKIAYLICYAREIIQNNHLKLDVNKLVHYIDKLPIRLGKDLAFMRVLIHDNCYNIKYLVYNEDHPAKQRELIQEAIEIAKKREFHLDYFLNQGGVLNPLLKNNLDFILYLIENDISYVDYLTEKLLENQTVSSKKIIIKTILSVLKRENSGIEKIEKTPELASFLNQSEEFISYILTVDIDYVRYIDWHNLTDDVVTRTIHHLVDILTRENVSFHIMNYPFRELFFQNYRFMEYLMKEDIRWIAITKVNKKEENNQLIDYFLKESEKQTYKFKLKDFLEDGQYLNYRLVENKKMLHYFFIHQVPVVQYINFLSLKSASLIVDQIVNELEKLPPECEFHNEEYLIKGKYPVFFSNHYRFMRYVIDKNFNNIAFMDISMIDKRELKRIINYAVRSVYYIRGSNKNLNFDLEGYFKNSEIIHDEYFLECLKSL